MASYKKTMLSLDLLFSAYRLIQAILLACVTYGLALPAMAANDYEEVERLVRANNFDKAMTKANALLRDKPDDPQMRFIKAVIQLGTGKLAEASAAFTQLTKDAPELPEPYNNLAVIYASQNQFDKAFGALESAIRTNPSYAVASENLGDLYELQSSQANNTSGSNLRKLAVIPTLFSPPTVKPVARVTAVPKPVARASSVESRPNQAFPGTPTTLTSVAVPAKEPTAKVESAVRAWAAAWASQDMDRYLAAYSDCAFQRSWTPVSG